MAQSLVNYLVVSKGRYRRARKPAINRAINRAIFIAGKIAGGDLKIARGVFYRWRRVFSPPEIFIVSGYNTNRRQRFFSPAAIKLASGEKNRSCVTDCRWKRERFSPPAIKIEKVEFLAINRAIK